MQLTLDQTRFFNDCNSVKFKNKVLLYSTNMGADGAFYFALGEIQSETKNLSFDLLSDDLKEDFIEALFIEFPELEF
jgi:hypothetical protein